MNCANALRVRKLNVANIQLGDRVECAIVGGKGIETRIVIGNVVQVDDKGRWFRIKTDDEWSHCHLFAAMEFGKSTYRILKRRKS